MIAAGVAPQDPQNDRMLIGAVDKIPAAGRLRSLTSATSVIRTQPITIRAIVGMHQFPLQTKSPEHGVQDLVWRLREGSNLQPTAPEAVALSD